MVWVKRAQHICNFMFRVFWLGGHEYNWLRLYIELDGLLLDVYELD